MVIWEAISNHVISFGPAPAAGFGGPLNLRMALTTTTLISAVGRTKAVLAFYPVARAYAAMVLPVAAAIFYRGSRQDVYNILWVVVFGFATLNILSLAARRMEPARRGLSFGELMAVSVVVLSVILLIWEMLNYFHVFPIHLRR